MAKISNKLKDKKNRQYRSRQIMLGVFLILFSILTFASLLSYFNTWRIDQSNLENFFSKDIHTINIAKKFGAILSHFLIYRMFGVASFVFSFLLFISGISYFVGANSKKLVNKWIWGFLIMIWSSIFFGYFFTNKLLAGAIGYELSELIFIYIGEIGIISILIFGLFSFLVIRMKITPEKIYESLRGVWFKNKK